MKIKGKQLHSVMAGLTGILASAQNAKIIREATAIRKEVESAINVNNDLLTKLKDVADELKLEIDPRKTVKDVRKIFVGLINGKALPEASVSIAANAVALIDEILAGENEEVDLLRSHIELSDEQIEKLCSRQNANGPLCTGEHIALAEPVLCFV